MGHWPGHPGRGVRARPSGLSRLRRLPSRQPGTGLKLEQFNTFTIKYLSFDHRVAPFNDVRVRQAINYATNKGNLMTYQVDGLSNYGFRIGIAF